MADLDDVQRRLVHAENEFEKMHTDMYVGQGPINPPLTQRVALLESTVKSIGSNLGKMVWLLVGIFVTIIGDMILHNIKGI